MQSFLANRPSVSAPVTTETASRSAVTAADFRALFPSHEGRGTRSLPGEGEAAEGPKVELVQENGQVRRIIITCRCCERIELECAY